MYYDTLAQKVKYHKQDSKGVQTMCKVVEEYGDERAAKAAYQKSIESAKNFLNEGDSPEKISRCIGLPLEKVL